MIRLGNVFVPTVPETFPPVCPCTGLPIRCRPEWVYTSPEHTYRTTFAQIGSHIFWVIPRGYVTEADMQQAIALAAAIKAETLPGDAPFVFIESFEHTTGGYRRCAPLLSAVYQQPERSPGVVSLWYAAFFSTQL